MVFFEALWVHLTLAWSLKIVLKSQDCNQIEDLQRNSELVKLGLPLILYPKRNTYQAHALWFLNRMKSGNNIDSSI